MLGDPGMGKLLAAGLLAQGGAPLLLSLLRRDSAALRCLGLRLLAAVLPALPPPESGAALPATACCARQTRCPAGACSKAARRLPESGAALPRTACCAQQTRCSADPRNQSPGPTLDCPPQCRPAPGGLSCAAPPGSSRPASRRGSRGAPAAAAPLPRAGRWTNSGCATCTRALTPVHAPSLHAGNVDEASQDQAGARSAALEELLMCLMFTTLTCTQSESTDPRPALIFDLLSSGCANTCAHDCPPALSARRESGRREPGPGGGLVGRLGGPADVPALGARAQRAAGRYGRAPLADRPGATAHAACGPAEVLRSPGPTHACSLMAPASC